MDIQRVRQHLQILNDLDGSNPNGNCTVCAVITADSLVDGVCPLHRAPVGPWCIGAKASMRKGARRKLEIMPDHLIRNGRSRAYIIWRWLKDRAADGVYVFEQEEDHVYNFVVEGAGAGRRIYLVDSATQVYRKVNTAGDCCAITPNYSPGFSDAKVHGNVCNTQYGYNYLNPQPIDSVGGGAHDDSDDDSDDEVGADTLSVYYWGPLNDFWKD